MAIYTNLAESTDAVHTVFESSNLKSSIVGNIYDVVVREGTTPIAVDNGVAVKVGDYTGDGLQTRYAKVAAKGDKIAILGTTPLVADAYSKATEQPTNFYNKVGKAARAYEVVAEDIFAVSKDRVSKAAGTIAVGDKVVWDTATSKYLVTTAATTGFGFVGRVHSIQTGSFYDLVRIECITNADVATA